MQDMAVEITIVDMTCQFYDDAVKYWSSQGYAIKAIIPNEKMYMQK
jgi:hypothetical protein